MPDRCAFYDASARSGSSICSIRRRNPWSYARSGPGHLRRTSIGFVLFAGVTSLPTKKVSGIYPTEAPSCSAGARSGPGHPRDGIGIPCVGASDAPMPIISHVTSALHSGDLTKEEMDEVILQFAAYYGFAKAEVLENAVEAAWASRPR
jgi:hypothetical protein